MKSSNVADQSLWRISWPLLVEFMLIMPAPALDSYFLKQNLSDAAAAGVAAVAPYFMICILIIQSLNQGGMAIAAQRMGARDEKNLSATFLVMLVIDVVVCTVIGIVFFFAHDAMAKGVGLQGEFRIYGGQFLSVVGTLIIFLGVRLTYASITAVYGKTVYNLISASLMVGVNILFNIIFTGGIFGIPNLGVYGVAAATVLGYVVSVLYNLYIVHRVLHISFATTGLRSRFATLSRPIFRISLPSMIEPVSFHGTQLIYNKIAVTLGAVALITRTYLSNILTVVLVIPLAVGIGTQILIGHLIGAKRFEEADKQMRSSTVQAMLASGILSTLIFIFSDEIIGTLFTKRPDVLALGHSVLLVAILLETARPINVVVGNALRASGDAIYTSLMGSGVMFLWSVPAVYLFSVPLEWGLVGIWFGMATDEIIRSIVNYRRWKKGRWRQTGIAVQPHQEASYAEKIS